MNDNNNTVEAPEVPDYAAALQAELGMEPPVDEASQVPTPESQPNDGGEQPPKADTEGEQQVPPKENEPADPQGGEQPAKVETPEEKANREATEAAEAAKPITADDVKNAVREYHSETQGRVDQVHQAREEIISTLYPEGIDRNIYDSDGKVIKTAQDIVDRGLINERTGEPYTYDEAASFMLEAGKQMEKNINELTNWAENIAEQNVSLVEGNQRVMDQWGDILRAMPQLASQLAEKYITTQLSFDKTGSYITNMATSPEDFYNLVMPAYKKLGEALVAQQQQEAEQQQRQQQTQQAERNGLPPQRGVSEAKANTGDPMLDALVDELNKG